MVVQDDVNAGVRIRPEVDALRRRVRWALGVVNRGKYIVLGGIACAMLPTVGYLYQAERLYTATAEVLIESPESGENLLERSYGKSRLTESAIQTEADILSSSSLAAKVVGQLNLTADPEFNRALVPPTPINAFLASINPLPYLTGQVSSAQDLSPGGREEMLKTQVIGKFLSRLNIRNKRRSYVISVSYTASNAEKAARIANTIADLYILDRLEAGLQETRRANSWLAARLNELREDVSIAEQAAEKYRTAHGLTQRRKGERLMSVADQQLIELNSRLVLARSELAQKQARHDQLKVLLRNRGSLETSYDVLQSQLIQRLREQESLKQRELSESLKTYGERHPRIIGQKADLEELRGKIAQEVEKIAVGLATEVESSRAGVTSMERQIESLKQSTYVEGSNEVELRELERQAETSRTLYESFLTRYKKDAEQERIHRANARVLSAASIPVQPSSPRRFRIFFGALLASSAAFVGLLFVLDRINGRVRGAAEAEDLTGLRVLGSIPLQRKSRKKDKNTSDLAYVVREEPRSALANAFRAVRTELFGGGAGTAKVVLVTSSVPKEGKSFVARNLAMSLAAAGSKVLLVDADLMRPTQHLLAGIRATAGLTEWLAQTDKTLPETIIRDQRAGVDLLPAGTIDEQSGNALSNGRIESLLQTMRQHYDHVIVDAPPVLAAADAAILSSACDKVVFAIKWNSTTRDALRQALSAIGSVTSDKIAGLLITQVGGKSGADFGYGYAYYEQYYRKA